MSDYPTEIDTGTSISVTPNARGFIKRISKSNIQDLKGLNKSTKVNRMGMVEWNVYNVCNKVKKICTLAYHVSDATIRRSPLKHSFQQATDMDIFVVTRIELLSSWMTGTC
jgi:hypothetical protein